MDTPNDIKNRRDELELELEDRYYPLLDRLRNAEDEKDSAREQVRDILDRWERLVEYSETNETQLNWGALFGGDPAESLLVPYGQPIGDEQLDVEPIGMMTTMRNVDSASAVGIVSSIER